jgi:prepilin-type N-terminal cleavage/methylation domain-containing protein
VIVSKKDRGFTLVEMAIVLTIVGILLVTMFVGGGALIEQAERKALIKQVIDIRAATRQFQERFRFLPGDFPANTEIQNILPGCMAGGAGVGNGDGLIAYGAAPSESFCANDHLYKSGLYSQATFVSKYGAIRLMSRADAVALYTAVVGAAPTNNVRASVSNVILLENVPCRIAAAVDEAFDDNVLNNDTGQVASFNGACAGNAPVWLVVAL